MNENLSLEQAKALLLQISEMSDEEQLKTYQKIFIKNGLNSFQLDPKGKWHDQFIIVAEATQDNDTIYDAYAQALMLYATQKDGRFESIYKKAQLVFKQRQKQEYQLKLQNLKVYHLLQTGQRYAALELGIASLDKAKKLQHSESLFLFYYRLAQIVGTDGERQKAYEYAQEALKHVPEHKKAVAIALAATCAVYISDHKQSFFHYQELEQWAIKNNHLSRLASAYDGMFRSLAIETIYSSDIKVSDQMINIYKKLMYVTKKIGDDAGRISGIGMLGGVYCKAKDFKKCIFYTEKALEEMHLHQTTKNPLTKFFYENLYESYKGIGDYEKALQNHEAYTRMREEQYNMDTRNKISELNASFEAEKRAEEITRLKKENELLDTIKAQKAELEKSHQVISEKNKQLEQINLTKDRLFAIIGHDLRKPVLSFRGIAKKVSYLLKKGDYKTLQLLGQGIEQDAYGLTKLTDNLLNWALTQREVMPYQPKALNLYHLTEDTLDIFKSIARDKNITLQHHIPDNLTAYADRNAVLTILRNLVDNAVKYTPSGGTVIVEALEQKEGITFKIKDTGVGMSAEKVRDIFLLQKDKSEKGTAGEKGTGLGMHLVQELVKLNKGNIRVMSQLGQGTTFEVVLPKVA